MREDWVEFEDWRLGYTEYGTGERVVVLVHGLLMNRRMCDRLAPALAEQGYRVITVDLLGHGRSDRPPDMRLYNMPGFAKQLAAVLERLELDRPVIGGTSLGANVSIELAATYPELSRGLFLEMPVLDNALVGAVLIFTPALLGLRFGKPLLGPLSALARRLPRTHLLADILLDWARQDAESSSAVLEGVLFGRTAPPSEERRRIDQPALVIGHPADPLHPFSDSDMLYEELAGSRLVEASSILEWRLAPERLDSELTRFLGDVYASGERSTDAPERSRDTAERGAQAPEQARAVQ